MALQGEESELAAQGAECANEQGAFWEFHDILYANQGRPGSGRFSSENLKRFAGALGLDLEGFGTCLDSGRYAAMVASETQAALDVGISHTPTILVNGREVENSPQVVREAILEELAAGS
jgi:protein-disulfide isomerase